MPVAVSLSNAVDRYTLICGETLNPQASATSQRFVAAAPPESKGGLMVVKMVLKPPQGALRGRSGSLRIRPLSCGFPLSG